MSEKFFSFCLWLLQLNFSHFFPIVSHEVNHNTGNGEIVAVGKKNQYCEKRVKNLSPSFYIEQNESTKKRIVCCCCFQQDKQIMLSSFFISTWLWIMHIFSTSTTHIHEQREDFFPTIEWGWIIFHLFSIFLSELTNTFPASVITFLFLLNLTRPNFITILLLCFERHKTETSSRRGKLF